MCGQQVQQLKEDVPVENDQFNMSLRKFLKHVGVTSQHEIERVVRTDTRRQGNPQG